MRTGSGPYPLSPRILLEQKAGAYIRSLPLVLLLVFQPPAFGALGGRLGRKWAVRLIGAQAPCLLGGRGGARWLHRPLVLRKNEGTRFLKVTWVSHTESPRVAFVSALPLRDV